MIYIKRSYFLVFLSFYLFWLFFVLFLHFRFPRCHSFIQSQSRVFLSLLLSKSAFSLYHVFLIHYSFFLLLFLCLVLFNSFSHLSLQTFLFHSFEISLRCISFSFPFFLYLFCVFHFSELLYFFFSLFHSLKTCSHSHREIRTNIHSYDKGTKRNVNELMNHPFATCRPLLHWAVRCTCRP